MSSYSGRMRDMTIEEYRQLVDQFPVDAMPIALIGHSGIGEAVGQHPVALFQRRPDGSNKMFAPGGKV